MKPRLGVLTSGSDCPGLNAVLRAPIRWREFLPDVGFGSVIDMLSEAKHLWLLA